MKSLIFSEYSFPKMLSENKKANFSKSSKS